jgi:hypothetical protein
MTNLEYELFRVNDYKIRRTETDCDGTTSRIYYNMPEDESVLDAFTERCIDEAEGEIEFVFMKIPYDAKVVLHHVPDFKNEIDYDAALEKLKRVFDDLEKGGIDIYAEHDNIVVSFGDHSVPLAEMLADM